MGYHLKKPAAFQYKQFSSYLNKNLVETRAGVMANLYIIINKILCCYNNFLLSFCGYGRISFSNFTHVGSVSAKPT